MNQLKLTPHLVPKPLFGKSAAQLFGRSGLWMQIRNDVLATARRTCEVCSATAMPLHCHEVWHYNDPETVATLDSLKALCDQCHTAVHMGRAVKYGKGGVAVAQLCKVNGIPPSDAKQLFAAAMTVWKKRSKRIWRIEVAQPLLDRYPQLAALETK